MDSERTCSYFITCIRDKHLSDSYVHYDSLSEDRCELSLRTPYSFSHDRDSWSFVVEFDFLLTSEFSQHSCSEFCLNEMTFVELQVMRARISIHSKTCWSHCFVLSSLYNIVIQRHISGVVSDPNNNTMSLNKK